MLECYQCSRGYHLTCLDPPLSEPPQVVLWDGARVHTSGLRYSVPQQVGPMIVWGTLWSSLMLHVVF